MLNTESFTQRVDFCSQRNLAQQESLLSQEKQLHSGATTCSAALEIVLHGQRMSLGLLGQRIN